MGSRADRLLAIARQIVAAETRVAALQGHIALWRAEMTRIATSGPAGPESPATGRVARGWGKTARASILAFFHERPPGAEVRAREVATMLRELGYESGSAWTFLSKLTAAGDLERAGHGRYRLPTRNAG